MTHKRSMYVLYLDQRFAAESRPKELPEGHLEMAATNAAQIKQCIRPCCQQENTPEAIPSRTMSIPQYLKAYGAYKEKCMEAVEECAAISCARLTSRRGDLPTSAWEAFSLAV